MEKNRRVGKNYLYNLLYKGVVCIIPIIATPYSARVFGADGVGVQSYTNAVAAYFILFAVLGTATYGTREIARTRDSQEQCAVIFWEIELIRIVTAGCSLALWVLFIFISQKYQSYYWALSFQILNVAADITWFFEGQEDYPLIVSRNLLIKFADLLFLLLLIKRKEQLLLYLLISSMGMIVGNLACWFRLNQFVAKVPIRRLCPFRHFREIVGYFIPTVAISIYTVLDKTMIGFFTQSEAENGYYEQAKKILDLGHTLVNVFPMVLSARMSYLIAQRKKEEIQNRFETAVEYCLFFSALTAFGTSCIAKQFVPWYLGAGYEKVVFLLYLMSPLIVIIGLSGTLGYVYLTPSGKRAQTAKAVLLGAAVNFSLNCILIPRYASVGAGIASVIAEIVVSAGYMMLGRAVISGRMLIQRGWRKILAASMMAGCLQFFGDMPAKPLTTVVEMIAGFCIYCGTLLILQDKFVLNLYREFMRKVRNDEI